MVLILMMIMIIMTVYIKAWAAGVGVVSLNADNNNAYDKDAYGDDDANDNNDYHDYDDDNNIITCEEVWASGVGFKIFECLFLKATNRKVLSR